MIHNSFVRCDYCGQRHTPDDTEECSEQLLLQREVLREERDEALARAGKAEAEVERLRDLVKALRAQVAKWELVVKDWPVWPKRPPI